MDTFWSGSSCQVGEFEPWGSNDNICCDYVFDSPEAEADALFEARCEATELVDVLTAGLFGFHKDRIMPCRTGCDVCYCDPCSCCRYDKLYLPFSPVCSLTRVVVDCVDQDLCDYRVDNGWSRSPYAVSLGGAWPTEQCYTDFCDPDDIDAAAGVGGGGWWVEYCYGQPVPKMGHRAVEALACEFVLQCFAPDKCSLPAGVSSVSRQGVTVNVTDAASFLASGFTGVAVADRFIRAYNPEGLRDRAGFSAAGSGVCRPGFVRPGPVVC